MERDGLTELMLELATGVFGDEDDELDRVDLKNEGIFVDGAENAADLGDHGEAFDPGRQNAKNDWDYDSGLGGEQGEQVACGGGEGIELEA
jgi:hypothetical protein